MERDAWDRGDKEVEAGRENSVETCEICQPRECVC